MKRSWRNRDQDEFLQGYWLGVVIIILAIVGFLGAYLLFWY